MQTKLHNVTVVGAFLASIGLATAAHGQAGDKSAATTGDQKQERTFTRDPRLDLSSNQESLIYQSLASAQGVQAPQDMPMTVGAMMPDSVALKDIPSDVKGKVEAVKNYKYVKLQDGKVLLVDPTNRVVVGIIAQAETVGTNAGNGAKQKQ